MRRCNAPYRAGKDQMTKLIRLTQGKVTLVDDCDYEFLSQWKWQVRRARNGKLYAQRGRTKAEMEAEGMPHTVEMHRVIMNTPDGMLTDHINGDGLDNRRSNLRLCTTSENTCNSGRRFDNKSGFKGVFWHKRLRKWAVVVTAHGKSIWVGSYKNPEEAAHAYDRAALENQGRFARTNFPKEGLTNETC